MYLGSTFENTFAVFLTGLGIITYLTFLILVIREPIHPLKSMTKREMDDHEYDRVLI